MQLWRVASIFDCVSATYARGLGSEGMPGGASVQIEAVKAVSGFVDGVAKDVFTVTIPNAQHSALIEVDTLGVLGAGGSIGAGESSLSAKYQISVARTPGANAIANVSSLIATSVATVAGGNAVASVVVTASAISGATNAPNTFTIKVAITRSGSGATAHTATCSARLVNANASGITIA